LDLAKRFLEDARLEKCDTDRIKSDAEFKEKLDVIQATHGVTAISWNPTPDDSFHTVNAVPWILDHLRNQTPT